ncbi:hypothetical protein V6N13_096766 [Hibiscus sabdariffa]
MRVLSWNVRGLGSSVKRSAIRRILRQQHIEMVFLVETKLGVMPEAIIKSIWWTDSFSFIVSTSMGLSRGIVFIWEVGKFDVIDSFLDSNFVLIRWKWCVDNWECAMIAVYAPCEFVLQQELWGCFVSFVEEAGLLDLPASGKAFTWFGTGLRVSPLDCFLVSPPWVEQFHGLEQFILQRGISDHAPVWLSSGVVDWGPRPFRFLNCWLEIRGHVKLMETKWCQMSAEAVSLLPILEKLGQLKGFLKVWNRESFGSVDLQIVVNTELLNDLEGRDDGGAEMLETRRQLQGNLWKLIKYRSSI